MATSGSVGAGNGAAAPGNIFVDDMFFGAGLPRLHLHALAASYAKRYGASLTRPDHLLFAISIPVLETCTFISAGSARPRVVIGLWASSAGSADR